MRKSQTRYPKVPESRGNHHVISIKSRCRVASIFSSELAHQYDECSDTAIAGGKPAPKAPEMENVC